jgi:hypothetical protein
VTPDDTLARIDAEIEAWETGPDVMRTGDPLPATTGMVPGMEAVLVTLSAL